MAMRSVCLKSGISDMHNGTTAQRLFRHLLARMKELEEMGLTAGGDASEDIVKVRFTGRSNAEAAAWLLRKRRIQTGYDPAADIISMQVTGGVSFEDLDYVQGAVMELLM